ncbi:MAG: SDR family oxidoreductase [Chloroflexi bacterium]|nr:SDR family oxidoreductase [Chloroflexota bacterium]
MGGRLKDRVAVITGAGRGIGRGIALAMAAECARVVVNDLGCETTGAGSASRPADDVVAEIRKLGGVAVASYDSVASMSGAERIINAALESFGRIDILVNNAGILRDRMIFNMAEAEWDDVIAVHLKGHFACTRFASALMRQQRFGRIINTSSTSGLYGAVGQANYGAAKAGIAGLTRVVARDLGKYGITVNAVVPAAATRLTSDIPERSRATRAGMGRPETLPDPDDVAPFVVYLAGDEADSINGQLFYVSGGEVSLLCHPTPVKSIYKVGRWTLDELLKIVPATLAKDLINPAPPQPPG